MAMSQTGDVTTADNCKIINNSFGAVRVKSVTITAGNDWSLTAFGDKSTLANEKVDANKLGFAMSVGGGDSADTAIQYGKICSAAFPAMGLFVNKARVKKYNIEIVPDFIFNKTEARLHTKISLRPIKLINAVFVLVFELLFKVVFKLLKHSKAPEEPKVEKQNNK